MKVLRKILGAPNALLRVLAEHLVIRWLREVGSGEHGATLQRAYNALAGKKTKIGLAIAAAAFVVSGLGHDQVARWLELASMVCVGGGLADKAVRNPGRPDLLADNYFYRLAADNSGLLAALLSLGLGYAYGSGCGLLDLYWFELSCAVQRELLGGATLLCVYLGILDVGFLSRTPSQAAFAARVRALERP